MRALDDVVHAGKALYVGVSDVPAWVVSQANTLADLRGWSRFIGLQIEYSLIERTPERELLPMARALDVGVTAWGSIGGGVLTGKYAKGGDVDTKRAGGNQRRLSDRNHAIAAEAVAIAKEIDRSASQVAINWVRQQPGTMIPILGARTAAQLEENLRCLDFELSPEHMRRLDEVSKIEMGFPHDFLSLEPIRKVVYGDTYDRLVIHHRR
jgi:aryl-alcohol dehydrogenase-like predicted oxidoreductase